MCYQIERKKLKEYREDITTHTYDCVFQCIFEIGNDRKYITFPSRQIYDVMYPSSIKGVICFHDLSEMCSLISKYTVFSS